PIVAGESIRTGPHRPRPGPLSASGRADNAASSPTALGALRFADHRRRAVSLKGNQFPLAEEKPYGTDADFLKRLGRPRFLRPRRQHRPHGLQHTLAPRMVEVNGPFLNATIVEGEGRVGASGKRGGRRRGGCRRPSGFAGGRAWGYEGGPGEEA